ncbi:unnamed protein product [Leptosia nina]|uniref:MutS-like protein n=1 Tax=Leptosia nina TaxID=320188 RepID=A0AAV1IY10_9NEOP
MSKLVENQIKINETLKIILDSDAYRDSSLIKYMKFAQHLAIITENIDDVISELIRIENSLAFIRASSAHHSMISIKVLDSYDLYRLSIAPNKYQQALIPPYPLIATNRKGYVYMEAECPKYNHWYLCGEKMDHQIRQQPDCTQELIINQALDKTCQMTTITLSRISLEELDEKHYIISFPNATKIHLRCARDDYTILSGTYLITDAL